MMRADVYLAAKGYARSREYARKLIESGYIKLDGEEVKKPRLAVDDGREHTVEILGGERYVSRGGLKLEGALDAFGVDVGGMTAVDIGASSGGFTDCLLKHGATRVYAVDSGHGQLSPELSDDIRVISLEGKNARTLLPSDLGEKCDIAVMDVSFISQTLILPVIPSLLREGGVAITLIKPQFEVGRAGVGKGGIVKSEEYRQLAVRSVLAAAEAAGIYPEDICESPITGGDGNREYLAYFKLGQGELGAARRLTDKLFSKKR